MARPARDGARHVLRAAPEDDDADGRLFNFPNPYDAGRGLRDAIDGAYKQLVLGGSITQDDYDLYGLAEIETASMMSPELSEAEFVPEVLVVGATGDVGRIITRKLLLRGFRVRALVRNLYSSTLSVLGPKVDVVVGNLDDPASLAGAVAGVDKIIYCAAARSPEDVELIDCKGINNVLSTWQDSRFADYGRAEATKRTLFKFKRAGDRALWQLEDPPKRVALLTNKFNNTVLVGTATNTYGNIGAYSAPLSLNLLKFSGVVLRVLGDGSDFVFVVRSSAYDDGIEHQLTFATEPGVDNRGKWVTLRLPFANFKPYRGGVEVPLTPETELRRDDIRQFGVAFCHTPGGNPKFYIALDYLKVYRQQTEPEVVLLSSSAIPTDAAAAPDAPPPHGADADAAELSSPYWKARGELAVKSSGLHYTIIRVDSYSEAPGGSRAIDMRQSDVGVGAISRADVAELCVSTLLDPRARNVVAYASQSKYAPSALSPDQSLSRVFERLEPESL